VRVPLIARARGHASEGLGRVARVSGLGSRPVRIGAPRFLKVEGLCTGCVSDASCSSTMRAEGGGHRR